MVWLKHDSANRPAVKAPERVASVAVPPEAGDPYAISSREPGSGASDVLYKLRKLIDGGQFPPGSRLPPERAMAAQFGAGRPLVREALKGLAALGVIESRGRAGTFVKARSGPDHEEAPPFGILELLEARTIVEPRAAWLAATRANERDLLEIEAARQQLEAHDQDWSLVAKLDQDLHSAIIQAARNPALETMYRALVARVLANQGLTARFVPDVARMRMEHKAIVEAVLMRSADAAEKAMVDHLHSVGLDYLSEGAR
jgi:GntR family transcriptional regulator, transcriptional repressor for pyruvate dehydrogenase complex